MASSYVEDPKRLLSQIADLEEEYVVLSHALEYKGIRCVAGMQLSNGMYRIDLTFWQVDPPSIDAVKVALSEYFNVHDGFVRIDTPMSILDGTPTQMTLYVWGVN